MMQISVLCFGTCFGFRGNPLHSIQNAKKKVQFLQNFNSCGEGAGLGFGSKSRRVEIFTKRIELCVMQFCPVFCIGRHHMDQVVTHLAQQSLPIHSGGLDYHVMNVSLAGCKLACLGEHIKQTMFHLLILTLERCTVPRTRTNRRSRAPHL